MPIAGFRISKYDTDLAILNEQVIELLRATRDAMTQACQALDERNIEKAEAVAHNDDTIDHLELVIHKTASNLIMKYQPIAQDLRQILASMRVASDLERIGDTAEGISRRVVNLGDKPLLGLRKISALGALVLERFNRLVEAYETRSTVNADDIREHDDDVDNAYLEATGDILAMMESDPAFVRCGAQLLSMCKSFERVGDRLQNIAEQILFEVDGKTEFTVKKAGAGG